MGLKAVIIEDESIAARRLASLVAEIAPDIEIVAQLSSVESSMAWLSANDLPQLLFLDIQLNDGYGFDILDQLESHPPVIFTTAYNEYAIRGFKYNGVDYLLKPIEKSELNKALNKFRKSVNLAAEVLESSQLNEIKNFFTKEYKHRFMVKVGNQFKSFNVEDIAYFKSNEGLIYLYTHDAKSFPVEYSIDQLESILNPIQFFRINRKFMVSVQAVEEIHSYFNSRLLLKLNPKEEEQVIVSRERTTNFKKWLDF